MMLMTALSGFSMLVLLGGFAYSGSLLPSESLSDRGHAVVTWLLWVVLVIVPFVTAIFWTLWVRD